jgi:ABC-type ATPase with predicted acetyltransferase domain
MMIISVEKKFEIRPQKSEQVTAVMRMFGVGIDRLKDGQMMHTCTIEVNDGDIVYITGPSGAGKSVLLREIQETVAESERINVDDIELPADKAVIDCVGRKAGIENEEVRIEKEKLKVSNSTGTIEALQLLSYTGLSDVFCMLNTPANLSEGQKYRYRLACALASGKKFVFADEFCSNLDRITAAVISYNVRKFAKRNNIAFFLASAHEDILADLQPDVLVVKGFKGEAEVVYKTVARRS